jgi:hypothetical protein
MSFECITADVIPSAKRNDEVEQGEGLEEVEGIFKLNSTAYYKGHNCAITSLVLTFLRIHYDINLDFKMYAIAFKRTPFLFFAIRKKL